MTAIVATIHSLITIEEVKQGGFPLPSDTAEPVAELVRPLTNGLRCIFETEDDPSARLFQRP